jgi:hypothetical protein
MLPKRGNRVSNPKTINILTFQDYHNVHAESLTIY